MIISEHKQGSEAWLQERAGIPTSSSFDMIVTSQGKPSKQRQKYLYCLAAERLTGVKQDHYQSVAMEDGIEREASARAMYELITGNNVREVGVCFPDERKLYGASPDGLIGKDGVLEIKSPLAHTHIGYLLDKRLPVAYTAQVQGQILVTDRKYVDFVSDFPGLPQLCVRIEPDKVFLKALKTELEIFVSELDDVTEKLRRA